MEIYGNYMELPKYNRNLEISGLISAREAVRIACNALKNSIADVAVNDYIKAHCILERGINGKFYIRCGDEVKLPERVHSIDINEFYIRMVSDSELFIQYENGCTYKMEFKKKRIFIINGVPTAGKDTLIRESAEHLPYQIINVSTIDMVKDISIANGLWDGVEKTDIVRNMLSDLKGVITKYTDAIDVYVSHMVSLFLEDTTSGAMFIHCREPKEIGKLKNTLTRMFFDKDIVPETLLVRRKAVEDIAYGNDSDSKVFDFDYDIIFYNDSELEESVQAFKNMIKLLCSCTDMDYLADLREFGLHISNIPAPTSFSDALLMYINECSNITRSINNIMFRCSHVPYSDNEEFKRDIKEIVKSHKGNIINAMNAILRENE